MKVKIVESDFMISKYDINKFKNYKEKELKLKVLKNEKFAFQLVFNTDVESLIDLNGENIHYKGLIQKYRVEVKSKNKSLKLNSLIVGFVKDDLDREISDPLLNQKSVEVKPGENQLIWIEGNSKISLDTVININIYSNIGYEDEILLKNIKVPIEVVNLDLNSFNKTFHLDLWQHLSNWANMYNVERFSKKHFEIIENYIKELASIGQKVVFLTCSDYLWAGQQCYNEHDNPSNLFESNMVKIEYSKEKGFSYDYSAISKYIDICDKYGINEEYDIIGLLGNWDANDFGNPIKDYNDPIRLKYYDRDKRAFKYIKTKEDLKKYIKSLFVYFKKKDLLDKIRVLCDEPDHPESFLKYITFIENSAEVKIKIKSAVHLSNVLQSKAMKVMDASIGINMVAKLKGDCTSIRENLDSNKSILTWYACCFPEKPNNFISSPRIESRLIGWFTKYFNLDGFLRWDYAIWPKDPFEKTRYKYPKWTAGDMFFVYPGRDMKPIRSQRWENLRFGIQDYYLLKEYEEKNKGKKIDKYNNLMNKSLGNKKDYKTDGWDTSIDCSLNISSYIELRKLIINNLLH